MAADSNERRTVFPDDEGELVKDVLDAFVRKRGKSRMTLSATVTGISVVLVRDVERSVTSVVVGLAGVVLSIPINESVFFVPRSGVGQGRGEADIAVKLISVLVVVISVGETADTTDVMKLLGVAAVSSSETSFAASAVAVSNVAVLMVLASLNWTSTRFGASTSDTPGMKLL